MKLTLEISTDLVVIGSLSLSAIFGITYVAATQHNINVMCIATTGIAFVTFLTLSLFNVTTIPPTKWNCAE